MIKVRGLTKRYGEKVAVNDERTIQMSEVRARD